MKPVRLIRKRHGGLVEFDESKIADAIYKAALSVGGEDRFLAEELASVVSLFLEKTFPVESPTIEDVQDMVEKVLIETGHARTAKAFILYRERRTKAREVSARPRPSGQRTLFEPAPLTVLDPGADCSYPFAREVLVRRLRAEAGLAPEVAEEIARTVEERLGELSGETVTLSVLDRIVDAELTRRGLSAAVRERGGLAISRARVQAALFPKERDRAGTPASRVSGSLLRQYALEEIYPPGVAAAHLSGRIALRGLDRPASVFAASVSVDSIRMFGLPGVSGRFRPEAAGTPRRFAAWLGRAVRELARHVTHGLALSRLNLLAAPILAGLSYDDLREEAWHLLSELAGVPDLEIELSLDPPPILAARKARGPDGEPLEETYSRFAGTSLQLARALLEVRGTGNGLGPRAELPSLTLTLGPEALGSEAARTVVGRALTEAMAREPVRFVLDREDLPLLGTAAARVRLEDASRLTDTTRLGVVVAASVALNLPRAAYRAGRGDAARLVDEVEAAVELAAEGIRARRRFLVRAGAAPDGPLCGLARGRGEAEPFLDLSPATNSIAPAGLNEAVAYVTGEELHESDEAVKTGQQVLSLLALKTRELRRNGLAVDVDAAEEEALAARFASLDAAEYPRLAELVPDRYTAGIALRHGAPVDLAERLEKEGRLGMSLRTATVSCFLRENDHPAPETVMALLGKTWENTRVRQLLLGRR